MNRRLIAAVCPHCRHQAWYPRETYLSGGHVQAMLEQTWFLQRCSSCQQEFELAYPFYYRDPKRRFGVVLSDREKLVPDERDLTSIQTSNPSQFYKAFAILYFDLDPNETLRIWKQLENKLDENVSLEMYDKSSKILWFKTSKGPCGIKCNRAHKIP